ncbi:MAG: glycosyltransferase family 39 protein [Kofleriaceae bacterium]|nr:glycosyltransferase family 39 protein [Kofleriaceae bacterium]MCB9573782.1 glycosyltransferase family 39 protein [Kofleriaceae bacterium]
MTLSSLLRTVRRPALAPLWALLLGLLVVVPFLGSPGLWEPQEMKVADDALARADQAKGTTPPVKKPPPNAGCPKEARGDDGPRTLTPRLAAWGASTFGSAEGDMRLPVAAMGVLCLLAIFGLGSRLAGPRAGLIAAAIGASFPLLVLQSRQLTSDIGTAAGASLLVYGLVAASRPAKWPWAIPDLLLSAIAVALGGLLAFWGGGAFLGLLPALAAVGMAASGVVALGALARLVGQVPLHLLARTEWGRPWTIGRVRPYRDAAGLRGHDAATAVVALLARLAVAVVLIVLFVQIYDVHNPVPNSRQILGKSIVPRDCWSQALGGLWRFDDDLRSTYDSMFEHAGFGMFPWGALAPVALLGLSLGLVGDDRRYAGRITLAWAALAWLTGTIFERKVGFAIYAGFPACAVAIAIWLDSVLARRAAIEAAGPDAGADAARALRMESRLAGMWALLGMIVLGKDLQGFPEKLTSLLVGADQIKVTLAAATKSLPLIVAICNGGALAAGLWLWRPRWQRDAATPPRVGRAQALWLLLRRRGVEVAIVLAALTGVFWAQVWQRGLSKRLSSKHIFAVYRDLRHSGDVLGVMGDMGNAPRYYADGDYETIKGRDGLIAFLDRPERAFAMVPGSELCAVHRAFAGKPYYVLDDSNARFLLMSNKVDGAVDKNPLSKAILRSEPEGIKTRFSATFDDRIELIGYSMPKAVENRSKFTMTLFFKVLKPVPGAWKIFVHFDGKGLRFQGDHAPIRERCATSYWQEGDYIVDTFEVEAGDITFEPGNYQARIGFFTGSAPNWKNMKVTQAPAGAKDDADRVLIGTIALQ